MTQHDSDGRPWHTGMETWVNRRKKKVASTTEEGLAKTHGRTNFMGPVVFVVTVLLIYFNIYCIIYKSQRESGRLSLELRGVLMRSSILVKGKLPHNRQRPHNTGIRV